MGQDGILGADCQSAQNFETGVSAMDAFHLAAAHLLGADESLTVGNPRKSIYRTKLVDVVCVYS